MSRDLILLGFSLMTWGIGEGMFFIFQPLYLQQLGASPVTIGVIFGAAGIAMTVAHIPAGHLADRIWPQTTFTGFMDPGNGSYMVHGTRALLDIFCYWLIGV